MSEGHNNPPVVIELTTELTEFLLDNCNTNLEFGLKSLNMLSSPDLQKQMVAAIENFKGVREAIIKARR